MSYPKVHGNGRPRMGRDTKTTQYYRSGPGGALKKWTNALVRKERRETKLELRLMA